MLFVNPPFFFPSPHTILVFHRHHKQQHAKELFQKLQSIYTVLRDPLRRRTYDKHGAEAAMEADGGDDDDGFVDDSGSGGAMDWSVAHLEELLSQCFKALGKDEVQRRVAAAEDNMRYEPCEAATWDGAVVAREIARVRELGVSEFHWTRSVAASHTPTHPHIAQQRPSRQRNRREIAEIPREIGTLAALPLTTVVLSHNKLTALPAEFGTLTTLQHVSLDVNAFAVFPAPLLALTRLETLSLAHNKLRALPREIGALTALRELVLFANDLRRLPDEVAQLARLAHLDVQCNFLKALPAGLLGRDGLRVDADPDATNQVILGAAGRRGGSRKKGPAAGKKRPAPSGDDDGEENEEDEEEDKEGRQKRRTRRAGRHP